MHRCVILLVVAFFLASANFAQADVVIDDEDGCDGKSAGDDCTDSGDSGTCQLECLSANVNDDDIPTVDSCDEDTAEEGTFCPVTEGETGTCQLTCDTSGSSNNDSGTTSCSLIGRVKHGPFISVASLLGGLSLLWMLRRKKV